MSITSSLIFTLEALRKGRNLSILCLHFIWTQETISYTIQHKFLPYFGVFPLFNYFIFCIFKNSEGIKSDGIRKINSYVPVQHKHQMWSDLLLLSSLSSVSTFEMIREDADISSSPSTPLCNEDRNHLLGHI